MKIFTFICLAILLGGCVSATPNLINGKYYMSGDKDCRTYRQVSENQVMCGDKNGKQTGYRNAMTDQELQMHMHNQQMQQQRSQQIQMQQQQNRIRTTNCTPNYMGGMNCTTF